jgi:hypothetical protein
MIEQILVGLVMRVAPAGSWPAQPGGAIRKRPGPDPVARVPR